MDTKVKNVIDDKLARNLIGDILESRHDPLELAAAHGLEPADLARWIDEPEVRRTVEGLCLLGDLQTQVMLTRYRTAAAGRLIRLAMEEVQGDLARKACVDLLKLDLKRADPMPSDGGEVEYDVREAMYGEGE